jgi:energy-coupling factor transporter ATP-binding protein EcfA2
MVTRVLLKNFKLHASTEIHVAPLTLLIGPNNSGKSSVFQALLALRQAATRGGQDLCRPLQRRYPVTPEQPYHFEPGEIVDIGGFGDVVRSGENDIAMQVSGRVTVKNPSASDVPVELDFGVHVRDNLLASHTGLMQVAGEPYRWEFPPGSRVQVPFQGGAFQLAPAQDFRMIALQGWTVPPNWSPEEQAAATEFAQGLAGAPKALLNSLHPVFPLRGFEEWGYPLPEGPEPDIERLMLVDRATAIVSILAYDQAAVDGLSNWLEDLEIPRLKTKLLPGKKLVILSAEPQRREKETPFTNEGTGANQLPFILVPIGLAPPTDTIMVCEPEAHLHPKAQSKLAALLLKIHNKEDRQFIIETHSEHVLHAFLRAVAGREIKKEQLAIYYFENEAGTAKVSRLEIDDKGRVAGGLPGFFEHSLAELSEYLDALSKA